MVYNKVKDLRYASTTKSRKRHYTYSTLRSFHLEVVQHIARDWWAIEIEGKTKEQLIEEIETAQEEMQ